MTAPMPDLPASPTEPTPESLPSSSRRHRSQLILAGVAVVAVGAGTGIALAASGESTSGTGQPAAAASVVPPAAPSASPSAHARAGKAIRATVISESGSTWTVRTQSGQTVTVTITPHTRFGTRKSPATRAAFAPGAPVLVLGREANGVIMASRVAAPVSQPSPAQPSATPVPPSPAATA